MKKIIIAVLIMTGYWVTGHAAGKTTLQGKVTDYLTGESIPGVTIYLPDLKAGAITDDQGVYKLENLPETKVLIQVRMIGYQLIAERIDLATIKTKDFALKEAVAEINEIVITGLSKSTERNRTPNPITTVSALELEQLPANNIIDAVANSPGVSQVTTGAAISKPVIRGLGYSRVVVVNDGVRQEGQQWGDEHGIEIDENSVNRVEIIKGPASLSYGSDAMAGVINFLPAPTLPDGQIKGCVLTNIQTNNGLLGGSLNMAGNSKGNIWDIRYSYKTAHAYQNKYDGFVFNSGFEQAAVSGITGINRSWGYSHLHFGMYSLVPGITEGERDSATGEFIKEVAVNDSASETIIVPNSDYRLYKTNVPFQEVKHYKAVLNNHFVLGRGELKAILGWQLNRRKEFDDPLDENSYGLFFNTNTFNYDFQYSLPELNKINLSFGVNGMYQSLKNRGTEFLIPDYDLFDIGVFMMAQRSFSKLDISGGIRMDYRTEDGADLWLDQEGTKVNSEDINATQKFKNFKSSFDGFSGSLGATYQFDEILFTKLNLSKGYRAPNIAELSANGVHEGTINYIIGSADLKPESSIQTDFSFGVNSDHVTAELNLFHNYIRDYIFTEKLQGVSGTDSITDGYATFKYTSGDATLYGGEFSLDIHPHPLDWLHFESSIAFVQAVQLHQPDSTKYLPNIPATKITTELRADKKNLGKLLANAYFRIGAEIFLKQDHFYEAYGTETATSGYVLLNSGFGADIMKGNRRIMSFVINITNLTDVGYQNHLSRLKYAPVNYQTGRTGVFNMGRNFGFKLIVPINIKN